MEGSVLLLELEELAGESYFATIVGTPRNDGERFTTTKSSHCSYKRCRISQSTDRKNNNEEDKAEVVVRREGNCNITIARERWCGKEPTLQVKKQVDMPFCLVTGSTHMHTLNAICPNIHHW